MTTIDLNSDIGESFGRWELGDDEAMLDLVTSANIACGFHAGDPSTIARTARWSVQRDVRIGAQVAYRDLAGFGRRFVDASRTELTDDVVYQIGGLQALAAAAGGTVTYVKPHGALYNTAVHHDGHATAVVDAVAAVDPGLAILGLPGSRLLELAEQRGLRVIREAFADRGYTPSATLVSRREPGAVLHDPDTVAERVLRMVSDGLVEAVDGSTVKLDVDSVCVHGDSPAAIEMARAVRDILGANDVEIKPFS
ncbi:LamB/YcsF family protein [Williamsia sp. DF01-3]|uniref:LamB/YcsF family protein n=1 Tax=Williamsia sp. DF01-3 TaxID=2934157 RepID=UPI001FF44F41|nr:5-oxoprolinase subunit PxpA [Williamsia sp. DF01-3]MCK0517715.1 LamB/YcsF family protein [Williamsia sp. DF01-3]